MDPTMDLWGIIGAGEYVILALAVLLIAAIWIWIARYVSIRKSMKPAEEFMHRMRDYIIEGDIENARKLTESFNTPVARMLRQGVHLIGSHLHEVRAAVAAGTEQESEILRRGSRWLWWISIVSPLIGLGGTLAGLAVGFHGMQQSGTSGDFASFSAIVWPTFITLICGLAVGIISLTAYTALESYIFGTKTSLQSFANRFIDLLNEPL